MRHLQLMKKLSSWGLDIVFIMDATALVTNEADASSLGPPWSSVRQPAWRSLHPWRGGVLSRMCSLIRRRIGEGLALYWNEASFKHHLVGQMNRRRHSNPTRLSFTSATACFPWQRHLHETPQRSVTPPRKIFAKLLFPWKPEEKKSCRTFFFYIYTKKLPSGKCEHRNK